MNFNRHTRTRMRFLSGQAVVGSLVSVVGLVIAPDRTWSSLLVAAFFLLTIGLG